MALQDLVTDYVRDWKNVYRVLKWKLNQAYIRQADELTYYPDDKRVVNLYNRVIEILSYGLVEFDKTGALLQDWGTRYSITVPGGNPSALDPAELRTIMATSNVLSSETATQGFAPQTMPVHPTSYYQTAWWHVDAVLTDFLKLIGRSFWYIEEGELLFAGDGDKAREFVALVYKNETLAQYAMQYLEENASWETIRARGLDEASGGTHWQLEVARSYYGKKIPSIAGGLYLLRPNAPTVTPPDPVVYTQSVNTIDSLGDDLL